MLEYIPEFSDRSDVIDSKRILSLSFEPAEPGVVLPIKKQKEETIIDISRLIMYVNQYNQYTSNTPADTDIAAFDICSIIMSIAT